MEIARFDLETSGMNYSMAESVNWKYVAVPSLEARVEKLRDR